MKSGRKPIDAAFASVLREEGLTWRQIGIELAKYEGRKGCYGANEVCRVTIRALRADLIEPIFEIRK